MIGDRGRDRDRRQGQEAGAGAGGRGRDGGRHGHRGRQLWVSCTFHLRGWGH